MMAKTPFGGFNSFRKPARKVSAFPQSRERSLGIWRPKLNERVQIPNGIGTVVEISGDMYLVDLDNQIAEVWERLTSITLPK
jgi:hypothetical protein